MQKPAEAGHAGIVELGLKHLRGILCDPYGSDLVDFENAPFEAGAALAEQHPSSGVEPDQEVEDRQGGQKNEGEERKSPYP
ncbi:aconitate hydratase 1 [Asticcacaulis excentricus CB 48]|uniref:Aconitate hydratase 1 n=1 Tax=Asticcacaulis excentricus (strain ATCC 15261 / DSM 4724 / KCTC 12464 / NCIMB 9791 / VKM B-1370 / CB 48) TaxID=573065 RepID=E8RNP6_ASTEC|nr:aconitate hydratase 1 [Asticcacaulis excentricus CB 48]